MNEIIRRLGKRIRQLRKQQGISQDTLGERSGLHNNYIGQVERGEKNVTIDSLSKIAAGLDVSMEELFRYIDPMKQPENRTNQRTVVLPVYRRSNHDLKRNEAHF
ncbi:Transcriptional regulator, contains XRE-family HTH domain [Paenibacillus uliginis N3/975]|uniref:Transcriptional regulator, contains XRE-family HTH domain n=1 Tax=Paenibacillus uliginis N3/975 TaxID=1313296 RepID=A0A1X7HVW6_9BACL|nr:helix-turn-helix transcriptional regulator [Paenibacillus uliginis]SMF92973.1 Transcriptional regulator, contains XRE-family HTH domain [Paenibacillus uliginis N3/975]